MEYHSSIEYDESESNIEDYDEYIEEERDNVEENIQNEYINEEYESPSKKLKNISPSDYMKRKGDKIIVTGRLQHAQFNKGLYTDIKNPNIDYRTVTVNHKNVTVPGEKKDTEKQLEKRYKKLNKLDQQITDVSNKFENFVKLLQKNKISRDMVERQLDNPNLSDKEFKDLHLLLDENWKNYQKIEKEYKLTEKTLKNLKTEKESILNEFRKPGPKIIKESIVQYIEIEVPAKNLSRFAGKMKPVIVPGLPKEPKKDLIERYFELQKLDGQIHQIKSSKTPDQDELKVLEREKQQIFDNLEARAMKNVVDEELIRYQDVTYVVGPFGELVNYQNNKRKAIQIERSLIKRLAPVITRNQEIELLKDNIHDIHLEIQKSGKTPELIKKLDMANYNLALLGSKPYYKQLTFKEQEISIDELLTKKVKDFPQLENILKMHIQNLPNDKTGELLKLDEDVFLDVLYEKHQRVEDLLYNFSKVLVILNSLSIGKYNLYVHEKYINGVYKIEDLITKDFIKLIPELTIDSTMSEDEVKYNIQTVDKEIYHLLNEIIRQLYRLLYPMKKIKQYERDDIDLYLNSTDLRDLCINKQKDIKLHDLIMCKEDNFYCCYSLTEILNKIKNKQPVYSCRTKKELDKTFLDQIKNKYSFMIK